MNPQRLYAKPHQSLQLVQDDIVRAAWRHVEAGRNDQSRFKFLERVTNLDGPKVEFLPTRAATHELHSAICWEV